MPSGAFRRAADTSLFALRFFYIDKTTLSYAAIFGIEEDLDLHGTQYNWLRYTTMRALPSATFPNANTARSSILDSLHGLFQQICYCRGYLLESISALVSIMSSIHPFEAATDDTCNKISYFGAFS